MNYENGVKAALLDPLAIHLKLMFIFGFVKVERMIQRGNLREWTFSLPNDDGRWVIHTNEEFKEALQVMPLLAREVLNNNTFKYFSPEMIYPHDPDPKPEKA